MSESRQVVFTGTCLMVLYMQLERWIDRLIIGDVDAIYLNGKSSGDGVLVELGSIKKGIAIEVFNYDNIGERYANKSFLYLYLGDCLEEVFSRAGSA